jgi:hypothetical protein
MDNKESVYQLMKDLGSLEQRMESMEKFVIALNSKNSEIQASNIKQDVMTEDDREFCYPFPSNPEDIIDATPSHLRSIDTSEYKVYIAVPFPEDGTDPFLFTITITRKELDTYLNQTPGKQGEYIYKITPSYEQFL